MTACICRLHSSGRQVVEGRTFFVIARVYWIPQIPVRLGIMARPRGGEWLGDEVRSLRSQGVDVVVSLLTVDEAVELELAEEGESCQRAGIVFRSFPILDRGIPTSPEEFQVLVHAIGEDVRGGRAVAIHCRAGIGRSSLVAACVLSMQGIDVEHAFALIAQGRGCSVPDTMEQRIWVEEFVGAI